MKTTVVVILILFSCTPHKITDVERIYKLIEQGTDSTYEKHYYSKNALSSTMTQYFKAKYKTEIIYDENSLIESIEGQLLDSSYGHYFDFYPSGQLHNYYYYTGKRRYYSYGREYSIHGSFTEQGTPAVDQINSADSITIFFSTVFYDSLDVQYRTASTSSAKLLLKRSEMLPMLQEATIKKTNEQIFIRIVALNKNLQMQQLYIDTTNP